VARELAFERSDGNTVEIRSVASAIGELDGIVASIQLDRYLHLLYFIPVVISDAMNIRENS
jgi:hypothetical protein